MRLGLFGGTFDPIHNAHLAVAREACDACHLDEVWFIPNHTPPHKADGAVAGWQQRFAMVALACAADPRFRASRLEEHERTSFTIHTLREVRRLRGTGDELFFLIGADAFAEIGSWYEREEVFRLVTFVVLSRPGHRYETPLGAKTVRLETLSMDVSSSAVRAQLAAGARPEVLPSAVLNYILVNGIYPLGEDAGKARTAAGESQ